MPHIHSIYRYPIKGLTAAPAVLAPGATIAGDRLYAIENGPSGFDPWSPAYLSKTHFLMLMKNERLASLRTAFDQASHTLTIMYRERELRRSRHGHPRPRSAPSAAAHTGSQRLRDLCRGGRGRGDCGAG
jgi:uncharacterized protein